MKTEPKIITLQGYERLRERLRQYEQRLAKIMSMKAEAAEVGGDKWHDNFSFEEIERLQKVYGSRISELKQQMRESKIISEAQLKRNAQKNKVCIGSKLKIKYPNGKASLIQIVGSGESDPARGLIAYDTPFGKALLNKKPSQKTFFLSNGKQTEIEIVELKHPD